jgi:tetratricopeptide (TPR) repeat protein
VSIRRVCGGVVQQEGHTDIHGAFSMMLGDRDTIPDGAETGVYVTPGPNLGISTRQLWNCEIRADLAGYRSSSILLAALDVTGPPDIGTIVLTKIGGSEGNSISVVSMKAPDNARREYAKGQEDYDKQKFSNAEKHLAKAVEIYPQYAVAWELRGLEQQKQQQNENARKSYQAAIAADQKFVRPYIRLAYLEATQPNWQEVLRLTDLAIRVDPIHYPDAYFLNGAAHYRLHQLPEAEHNAQKAVDLDKQHRFVRSELLLGLVLRERGNQAAATQHLRTYLSLVPNCPEAPQIRTYLAKVDQQNASVPSRPRPSTP